MAVPHAIAGVNGASAIVIAVGGDCGDRHRRCWRRSWREASPACIAAVLLAFTPVFLFQSIQPMSDVPVTAAWMLCFLLAHRNARRSWAGIACALAVLIRPNLAPLAIVPLFLVAQPHRVLRFRWRSPERFWRSCSGSGTDRRCDRVTDRPRSCLRSRTSRANASRYFSWLIATAPVLLLAVFGFWRLRSNRTRRRRCSHSPCWSSPRIWSTRSSTTGRTCGSCCRRWRCSRSLRRGAGGVDRSMAGCRPRTAPVRAAAWRDGARLWSSRGRTTRSGLPINCGRVVARRPTSSTASVPASAVILSGEQSGSMRYYTGRPILRWEAATPESLAVGGRDARGNRASRLRRPRRMGERTRSARSFRRVPAGSARLAADARSRHVASNAAVEAQRSRSIPARRAAEHHSTALSAGRG